MPPLPSGHGHLKGEKAACMDYVHTTASLREVSRLFFCIVGVVLAGQQCCAAACYQNVCTIGEVRRMRCC